MGERPRVVAFVAAKRTTGIVIVPLLFVRRFCGTVSVAVSTEVCAPLVAVNVAPEKTSAGVARDWASIEDDKPATRVIDRQSCRSRVNIF
jgi:hypothetical protein